MRRKPEQFIGSQFDTDHHRAKFWSNVNRAQNAQCWTWKPAPTPQSYGSYFAARGHVFPAHRVAYELFHGRPIPQDLVIDHLCRNPSCVNPNHLEPVTQKENCLRGISPAAQKARQTTCLQGHPLDGDNLKRRKTGHRICKICRRQGIVNSRRRTMAERRKNGQCADCGKPSERYRCAGCRAIQRARYAAWKAA